MKLSKQEIQDLYFMDARCKLLEIASFLDRIDRHEGQADFRHEAFLLALEAVQKPHPGYSRTQSVHLAFSDPSEEPLERSDHSFANGAHNSSSSSEVS